MGQSYSTSFAATENPISESGTWVNGLTDGHVWSDVKTTGGNAVGLQLYDATDNDSTALRTGTWAADQYVRCTAFVNGPASAGLPELEIRLRSTLSAHVCTGYEVLWSVPGSYNCQVQRWDGLDDHHELAGFACPAIDDGDILEAAIVGGVIKAWRNGVLLGTAPEDLTYSSGNPGIGFFSTAVDQAENDKFGWKDFYAQERSASAVVRISSAVSFENTANSGTAEIAIPADAELCVVSFGGYIASPATPFSGGALTLESTAMTAIAGADGDAGNQMVGLWWVPVPAGWRNANGTLAWNWLGTSNSQYSYRFMYGFYKNVHATTPVRDGHGAQGFPYTTPTLDAEPGDFVVAAADHYRSGATTATWTNATAVSTLLGGSGVTSMSWAEGTLNGADTLVCTWSATDDGGICALVLIPAAGGQIARPVSDVSVGNWTASSGTDRYAMVDEETASDTDYITSGAAPANDECVLALGALSTPVAGTVTLRVRAKYV